MFTGESLQQYPDLVKACTGLPAAEFWRVGADVTARWADEQRARQERPDRQRAIGRGRRSTPPLAVRVAAVLTDLRLHVPQQVVGLLFGDSQAEVSREVREPCRAAAASPHRPDPAPKTARRRVDRGAAPVQPRTGS